MDTRTIEPSPPPSEAAPRRFKITAGTGRAALAALRRTLGPQSVRLVGTRTALGPHVRAPAAAPDPAPTPSALINEIGRLRRKRSAAIRALEDYRDLLCEQLDDMQNSPEFDDETIGSCEAQVDLLNKAIVIVERELGVVGVTARPEDDDA